MKVKAAATPYRCTGRPQVRELGTLRAENGVANQLSFRTQKHHPLD